MIELGRGRQAVVMEDGNMAWKVFLSAVDPKLIAQEGANTQAAWDTGFPAPRVLAVEHDRLGLQKISGPTMEKQLLSPHGLHYWGFVLGQLRARMHSISGAQLPPQRDILCEGIRKAPDLDGAVRQKLLERVLAQPPEATMCHGDYHPGNILLAPSGPVVIDWINATSGWAAADAARTVLLLQAAVHGDYGRPQWMRAVIGYLQWRYRRGYGSLRPWSEEAVRYWLQIVAAFRLNEGIPEEERYLRQWLDSQVL